MTTETNKTEKTPPSTPTLTPAPEKASKVKPVYALHTINGAIKPGHMFRPDSADQLAELETLEAVRDLNEQEEALFAKIEKAGGASEDVLG